MHQICRLFGYCSHFHNVDTFNPRTWNFSPLVYVTFNLFHQCHCIFKLTTNIFQPYEYFPDPKFFFVWRGTHCYCVRDDISLSWIWIRIALCVPLFLIWVCFEEEIFLIFLNYSSSFHLMRIFLSRVTQKRNNYIY